MMCITIVYVPNFLYIVVHHKEFDITPTFLIWESVPVYILFMSHKILIGWQHSI
jgi:hypothetical protein